MMKCTVSYIISINTKKMGIPKTPYNGLNFFCTRYKPYLPYLDFSIFCFSFPHIVFLIFCFSLYLAIYLSFQTNLLFYSLLFSLQHHIEFHFCSRKLIEKINIVFDKNNKRFLLKLSSSFSSSCTKSHC